MIMSFQELKSEEYVSNLVFCFKYFDDSHSVGRWVSDWWVAGSLVAGSVVGGFDKALKKNVYKIWGHCIAKKKNALCLSKIKNVLFWFDVISVYISRFQIVRKMVYPCRANGSHKSCRKRSRYWRSFGSVFPLHLSLR